MRVLMLMATLVLISGGVFADDATNTPVVVADSAPRQMERCQ